MKKIIYLLMVSVAFILASCEKDDIGGTSVEAMAGEWYVTVTCVDEDGATVYEDDEFFGLGSIHILTYNTSDNTSDQLWVNDLGNFWDFAVKATCDLESLTFTTNGEVENYSYECNVEISGGKIIYDAATTPSGMPADSIVFYVSFDDDPYPAYYGFENYKISGYRYTGLDADE